MTITAGNTFYEIGAPPVTGVGVSWSPADLDAALIGGVADVVFDTDGKADASKLLMGLADTEFDQNAVRRLLETKTAPEEWRIGEALAEAYLTHQRQCEFPWPDSRDERKAGSSLPGADLVGFHGDGGSDRFAFGEVKTSTEAKYPPGAMHGRMGLKQQLEDLRDNQSIRDQLVKYLCRRASLNPPWRAKYERACKRYLTDSTDVRVFGVMVRDVPPHEDDLRVRVTKLAEGCPVSMQMELIAIYLPPASIAELPTKVAQTQKGGAA
ncbi:MAG TPA: hypothetical protein VI298_11240 [Geobacteraceae bacterium]